nr:polysaccharide pyruvyl transferase family protein [Oryzicola mucosus]
MLSRRSVFLTGTFDVANYGDLLFPLVAAERLSAHDIDVIPVSPTEMRPAYADAMAPISADRMLHDKSLHPSSVLVGGGYILMTQSAGAMPAYDKAGVAETAYPSLWIGAALAAAIRDIPLAWNAPGAPFPFPSQRREEVILPALRAADYLSVRDAQSANLFGPHDLDMPIVPDTVLDLPRVWPRAGLVALHRAQLAERGLPVETRTLAVHVRARAMGDPAELAALIDIFAEQHGLYPLLLVLGRDLGDDRVARRVSSEMKSAHGVVDNANSLRELAATIAGSSVYVGGSFHGYVTAAAYDTPAVMVAIPSHGKFTGLLDQLDRPKDCARDWSAAFARAHEHLAGRAVDRLPASVSKALDLHWEQIVEALRYSERGSARRVAFLRTYLRLGAERFGSAWLVSPHLAGMRPDKPILNGI